MNTKSVIAFHRMIFKKLHHHLQKELRQDLDSDLPSSHNPQLCFYRGT
jgi:hypothetical protein